MTFEHENNYEPFPELPVHNINGLRFYEAPNGKKYPSITTVLGKQPGKQKVKKQLVLFLVRQLAEAQRFIISVKII